MIWLPKMKSNVNICMFSDLNVRWANTRISAGLFLESVIPSVKEQMCSGGRPPPTVTWHVLHLYSRSGLLVAFRQKKIWVREHKLKKKTNKKKSLLRKSNDCIAKCSFHWLEIVLHLRFPWKRRVLVPFNNNYKPKKKKTCSHTYKRHKERQTVNTFPP